MSGFLMSNFWVAPEIQIIPPAMASVSQHTLRLSSLTLQGPQFPKSQKSPIPLYHSMPSDFLNHR